MSVFEDSWENYLEADKTTDGYWWDTVLFHSRMWNYKHHFYLETVTGEIWFPSPGKITSGLSGDSFVIYHSTGDT